MTKLNLSAFAQSKTLLFVFFVLFLAGCGSFPKAYRAMIEGETKTAKELFKKSTKNRTYKPGARYYYEALSIYEAKDMAEWKRMHDVFCELEEEVKNLRGRQFYKLAKYKVTPGQIRGTAEKLEARILEQLCNSGSIAELDALYNNFPCWKGAGARDTVRDIIVNKLIASKQPVYDKKECRDWASSAPPPPSEAQILTEKGRACASLVLRKSWQITYEDATGISDRYADAVLNANYPKFWDIQENIWDIFMIHHSFCDMDRFRIEHPNNPNSQDCWFDSARDTLCLSLLRPLLAFHRNNPHTALDVDVCNQILCLANTTDDAGNLDAEEQTQVEDVRMMVNLQDQIICRNLTLSSPELISKVAYLAKKYPHHRAVYDLALRAANYFSTTGQLAFAKEALNTFKPLFPDKEVCPTNFYFQTEKQQWFDNYAALIEQAGDKITLPQPVFAWNTPDNDEYALVSWGESDEVFFMRRNRETGTAQVMTSKQEDDKWTKPAPVPELFADDDIVPLSISADGRLMVLRSGGKLLQAYRHNINRRWSRPGSLPVTSGADGRAMLSPNGAILLQENYTTLTNIVEPPKKDIFASKAGTDGRYGRPALVGGYINMPGSDEGAPFLALEERLLFYTSNNKSGLGGTDMYSVTLTKAGEWTTAGEPMNLGLQLNTIFDDNGLTFFSEYTGKGYFDRFDKCSEDTDIWDIEIRGAFFPKNTMRMAGLVLDENRRPIGGGFMEFTTDYNLRARSQPISSKGTYTYTSPDSAEVVRLFPEIPGYYSEHDTRHFLANMPKGEIIRDTFILTSFEYIRQHFKLVHSTFINGTPQFDNPDKSFPELTRLAKIATRMGAELDLIGHTDGTGAESANQQLSSDRAKSVKRFLVEKCGFDPAKIKVFGYGPTRPLCPNDTEAGRRCNRRVEVVFRMPVLPSEQGRK
ncbi:MAG: OmpA family protein [Saprospiraceae bacterium]|nr:OmpA family protein [Saprospiraceae bacterium]MDZ4705658.1 OmpA family protein [Saprospiraceae bacterium]